MKSQLGHLQVNIDPANLPFYKDLMAFLGWDTLYDGDGMLGVGGTNGASLWFTPRASEDTNDYDAAGTNHLGIQMESQADVDAVASYLQGKGVAALFETPRHRPEFSSGPDQTYYQVMFETPDRILLEAVYTGTKS